MSPATHRIFSLTNLVSKPSETMQIPPTTHICDKTDRKMRFYTRKNQNAIADSKMVR